VAEPLDVVVVDGVFDPCVCEVVRAEPSVVDALVSGVDEAVGALDWLELEPAAGNGTTTPPCTVLDPSEVEVSAAALL
jgi:hypothetical protein